MGKMVKVHMGFQDSPLRDDRTIETNSGQKFTVGELRNFLREADINPSDLFIREKISDDPQIKKHIEEQIGYECDYREKRKKEKEVEAEKKESLIPELQSENNDEQLLPCGYLGGKVDE